MAVINSGTGDGDMNIYKRRVQVALGLVRWKSGKSGGQAGGNGDNKIDSTEVSQVLVAYPSNASNEVTGCRQVGGSWSAYVDYVSSSSSLMSVYNPGSNQYGDPNCRYRFGLKTWVDFILDRHPAHSESPGLAGAPEQPMQTMVDVVWSEIGLIRAQQADDQVGMAGFGAVGYGPAEKPDNMSWVTSNFDSLLARTGTLQAAMWSSYSNAAQGIDSGMNVLFGSPQARPNADKILVLMTDGYPNCTRGPAAYDPIQARADVESAVRDAAAMGVTVHTIGVGEALLDQSVQDWLSGLAATGHGTFFTASGDASAYRARLLDLLWRTDACR